MRKLLMILLALILVVGLTPAYASVGTQEDGTNQGAAVSINFSTGLDVSGGTVKTVVVDLTEQTAQEEDMDATVVVEPDTPDTLTTTEGGTTFIATSEAAGGRKFDLPSITAADNGVFYRIVGGSSTTTANRELVVHAQDGDIIYLTGSGTAGASVRALTGDIGSDSYPVIEIMAYNGNWYVTNTKGTWAVGA